MAKINFKKVASRVAGVAAGTVAGDIAAARVAPNMNPIIKGVALIAVGAMMPEFAGKKGGELVQGLGDGIVASGARVLGQRFLPGMYATAPAEQVSGIGADEERAFITDEGFSNLGNPDANPGLAGEGNELENAPGLAGALGNDESDYDY